MSRVSVAVVPWHWNTWCLVSISFSQRGHKLELLRFQLCYLSMVGHWLLNSFVICWCFSFLYSFMTFLKSLHVSNANCVGVMFHLRSKCSSISCPVLYLLTTSRQLWVMRSWGSLSVIQAWGKWGSFFCVAEVVWMKCDCLGDGCACVKDVMGIDCILFFQSLVQSNCGWFAQLPIGYWILTSCFDVIGRGEVAQVDNMFQFFCIGIEVHTGYWHHLQRCV